MSGNAQSLQHAANQCCFAGTKIAGEVDDEPWLQAGGQLLSKALGGRGIRQKTGETAIIASMHTTLDDEQLAQSIKGWARTLGFTGVAIGRPDLRHAEPALLAWLAAGFHGEMDYMARHGVLRARPTELVPGTRSVISVFMPYLQQSPAALRSRQADAQQAVISSYALGRDYHKVLRQRLQQLATQIETVAGPYGYRVFVDSAPILEVEQAVQAGLGWRGKHTLLINQQQGSFFFLGEILTDLPLPWDRPQADAHCGRCSRCLTVCPTQAIVAPYQLDARRCISYLTIELKGSIPEVFRSMLGNRVYGCDDCQLICPWNRFAVRAEVADFTVRHGLDSMQLVTLFAWSAADFAERMAGSPIYRIGYEQWLRNLAVGLGNAPTHPDILAALQARAHDPSALVREHVLWALARHGA